jgi:hypothetical protein
MQRKHCVSKFIMLAHAYWMPVVKAFGGLSLSSKRVRVMLT